MNHLMAALTSGLAVAQAAQGAQNTLSPAGWCPPVFAESPRQSSACLVRPAGAPRVENRLSNPPNAIKVGASSDLGLIVSLNPYAPAAAR